MTEREGSADLLPSSVHKHTPAVLPGKKFREICEVALMMVRGPAVLCFLSPPSNTMPGVLREGHCINNTLIWYCFYS